MTKNRPAQTLKRVAVGLLASLVAVAPFALTPASAAACGTTVGNWTTIPAPSFPDGPKAMLAFTVDPRRPSVMFASNGRLLMRSLDGGCSWKKTYEPETNALPAAAVEPAIEEIAVPEAGGGRVYAMLAETVGPAKRPRVVRSDDGGRSWRPAEAGLPVTGDPAFLRVAPSNPDVVYLAVAVQGVIELLFGSDDGGVTWTLRNNFARSIAAGVSDVQVDPQDPQDVWVGAADGLYHSTNGGRTFQSEPEFTGTPIGPIDVFHAGGPASLMVFDRSAGGGSVSNDGGENWLSITSPGMPSSVVHGNAPEDRMVSSVGDVWVYLPNLFSWVSARAPLDNIRGLVAERTSAAAVYGFTPSTIAVYRGPTGTSVKTPPEIEIRPDRSLLDPGVPPAPQPAKLTPARRVVRIDAGDSKTVPYNLLLPESKTPLDVYFLVDTSSSQKRFITGMGEALQGIVNGLIRSGADVRFGLGAYDNYPDSNPPRVGPPDSGPRFYEPNDLYQQLAPMMRETTVLEDALEEIEADGGGYYNAQLEALYQAATGEGADVEPAGPGGRDVPPGQHAEFRRGALKIALLVSDEEFVTEPLDTDPTPPDLRGFDETVEALNDKSIHQVGVSLRQGGTAHATPYMREMARRTDALAPVGGVDCDGDGDPDVAAGRALVCEFDRQSLNEGVGLTDGIVNLVESIRTRATLALEVRARDEIVRDVTPESYESLLLQASDKVTFEATFRCPLTLAGRRFPVKVSATGVDGSPTATATVVCRSVARSNEDEEEELLPMFPIDRVLGLIPLVPVGPPPPITELASSTQAQAQSQAQAQAQASMAAQEQEQPQLAFVHAMHSMRRQAQEEYAMSAFSTPAERPGHGVALAGATLLMSLGAGLALARQRAAARVRRAR